MARWGRRSRERIATCDPLLKTLFDNVIQEFDCTVLEGHRNQVDQNEYFMQGRSKVRYPDSKHNVFPSEAIDVAPWIPERGAGKQVPWPEPGSPTYIKDLNTWYLFVGFVSATALHLGINVRSGADWDRDHDLNDQTFDDLGHWELLP